MPGKWLITTLACLYFCIATTAFAAQGTEEILNFHVDIRINADASINVTETITAYAAGNVIKRGLVRALPTHYIDGYGITRHVRYNLESVAVGNTPSPYHTRLENDYFKIYVGKKNVLLHPDVYTYQFRYHVNDAVNFLKNEDEFYWNVTGNNWAFPIEQASITVTLPQTATILQYAGYTGKHGSKDQHYEANKLADNIIELAITKPLRRKEGFTIGVGWQKGVITEPTFWQRMQYQFGAYKNTLIPMEIACIVLLYYLAIWYYVGRDPKPGTIIPLFEPPNNISPAGMRYIMKMGFDNISFTAAIVSLAVKGALTIEDKSSTFTLSKQEQANTKPANDETSLLSTLFSSSKSLVLKRSNNITINKAKKQLKKALASEYKNRYFITNAFYVIPGILLSLLALVATVATSPDYSEATFAIIWLTGWSIACVVLVKMAITAIKRAYIAPSTKTFFAALGASAFALPFLGGAIVGLVLFSDMIPLILLILLFIIVLINMLFIFLLKAPTKEGRKVMDKIEGFKRFLCTTEKYRLQQQSTTMSQELFETYLPFAIALGVETEWGNKFAAHLKQSGARDQTYHPAWYSGRTWSSSNINAFSAGIGAGLCSSIATASISSSSSGSGGGGFSGGGGGGGGGGGW